jgi:hypothetical protein
MCEITNTRAGKTEMAFNDMTDEELKTLYREVWSQRRIGDTLKVSEELRRRGFVEKNGRWTEPKKNS